MHFLLHIESYIFRLQAHLYSFLNIISFLLLPVFCNSIIHRKLSGHIIIRIVKMYNDPAF